MGEALELSDEFLEMEPDAAEVWERKGLILADLGMEEESISCYDRAIAIDPRYSGTWNNKGVALAKSGKWNEALKCFEEAIQLDPKFSGKEDVGKKEETRRIYDNILRLDPRYGKAWTNKGVALANLGRWDEALEAYDHAIRIDPKFGGAWNNKGIILANLNRWNEALHAYDQAIRLDLKNKMAWYNKGNALRDLRTFKEALNCYDEALQIDPEYVNALYNKGIVLKELALWDEALECYEKARVLDQENLRIYMLIINLLIESNRYSEAMKYLDGIFQLDPEDFWGRYVRVFLLFKLGMHDEIIHAFFRIRSYLNVPTLFIDLSDSLKPPKEVLEFMKKFSNLFESEYRQYKDEVDGGDISNFARSVISQLFPSSISDEKGKQPAGSVQLKDEKIPVRNKKLNLSNKGIEKITEIRGLAEIFDLQVLDLSKNLVREIEGLQNLTELQELDLSDNRITKIEGLENLAHLKKINLHGNLLEGTDRILAETGSAQAIVGLCREKRSWKKRDQLKEDVLDLLQFVAPKSRISFTDLLSELGEKQSAQDETLSEADFNSIQSLLEKLGKLGYLRFENELGLLITLKSDNNEDFYISILKQIDKNAVKADLLKDFHSTISGYLAK